MSSEKGFSWIESIGKQLIKEVSIEFGKPSDKDYQKITHKPCKVCGIKSVSVRDEARGYPTMHSENICYDCVLKTNSVPGLLFIP